MVVGQADGKMRFWRNTGVATLGTGRRRPPSAPTLGYEWDEDLDNGFRPAGVFRLSRPPARGDRLQDYGSTLRARARRPTR